MSKLYFIRDVLQSEWPALDRDFKEGQEVTQFRGHTYGLDRDDLMYGGRETIPICRPEEPSSFFTVPVEFLADSNGVQPSGAYVRFVKRPD